MFAVDRSESGFTLTELIIVIAIIGVLAAIAVPFFLNQTGAAEQASLESDLATAMSMLATSEALGYTSLPSNFPNTAQTTVPGVGEFQPTDTLTRVGTGETLCVEGTTPSGVTMSFSQSAGIQEASCPNVPNIVIEYTDSVFTTGSNAETLSPTVTGGVGTLTYSVAGTLPTGVTFSTVDGTFTGPVSSGWNFKATDVTAGSDHACAISTLGEVWCWGDNSRAQLGQAPGALSSSSVPVKVDLAGNAWPTATYTPVQVEAGNQFTCVMFNTGDVTCWGSNVYGTIANGDCGYDGDPVNCLGTGEFYEWDISFLANDYTNYTDLSAGSNFVCGVLDTDEIACWGENENSQIGSGSFEIVVVWPEIVAWFNDPQPSTITSVVTGGEFAAALLADGSVYGWGKGSDGSTYNMFGNSVTTEFPVVSTQVDGTFITSLTAGFNSMCGVTAAGGAVCWGDNDYGQLGNGTTTPTWISDTAVPVSGMSSGVASLQASEYSVCALSSTGGVQCWGANQFGQLGDGSTTDSTTPVQVVGLTSGVTVLGDMASIHFLADTEQAGTAIVVTSNGTVRTWGEGTSGQLGDGGTSNTSSPVSVTDSGPTAGFPAAVTVSVLDSNGGTGVTSFNLTQS